MPQTAAQRRSEFAIQQLAKGVGDQEKFTKLMKGLPAMILQNGFGQTLSFILARGKDKIYYQKSYEIIANWLKENKLVKSIKPSEFMAEISKMDQRDYLVAQQESLTLLEWVKRFAAAGLFAE